MLLRAISPSDPITALALAGIETNAPILRDLQFYSRNGNADSIKTAREGATTNIFRPLNTNNTAVPPVPVYEPVLKKIISFDAKVDVVLEDRNEDMEAELAQQTRLEAEDAGYIFQKQIFEGSAATDANSFDGLRNLVTEKWLIEAEGNGIVVPVGNADTKVSAQQLFIEKLLQRIETVKGGASHLYINQNLKARLITVAKNLGYYRQSKDELGNYIEQINDTIIRGAGYEASGETLLPFNETVGEANNCTSIFFVRWGERKDLTALTSVGLKGRYAGQVGNFITNNINMDMALALQNPSALVQWKGLRLE